MILPIMKAYKIDDTLIDGYLAGSDNFNNLRVYFTLNSKGVVTWSLFAGKNIVISNPDSLSN